MDTSTAAKAFCKAANIPLDSMEYDQAYKMVAEEADFEKANCSHKPYSDCLIMAVKRMVLWHLQAKQWDTQKAHSFVASHRRTCSWTVLHALDK